MENYRDLRVWQQALELAVECYRETKSFPRDELFGMTNQIRRCSASIPANIAEGWGRQSTGDYIKFLRIAQGSLKELETHFILSHRVDLVSAESLQHVEEQTSAIGRMLAGLIRSLKPPS